MIITKFTVLVVCQLTENKIAVRSMGGGVKIAVFGVVRVVDDAGKTYKCGKCESKF